MLNWNERNRSVIEGFRVNGGEGRGPSATPLLLLTTTGVKTGQRHTTPLNYLTDGDRFVVFASKGGGPTNPDWYHNLVAHPTAIVEVGTETFGVDVVITSGEERDRLYGKQAEAYPTYAEMERRTSRKIPVVTFRRKR